MVAVIDKEKNWRHLGLEIYRIWAIFKTDFNLIKQV